MERCILIDTEKMTVLKVHTNPLALVYWADILIPQGDNAVRGYEQGDFNVFTIHERKALYESLYGVMPPEFKSEAQLELDIRKAIDRLPEDTSTIDELKQKLGRPLSPIVIPGDDEPERKRSGQSPRQSTTTQQPLKRPAEGTTTGQVWDIADEVLKTSDYGLGSQLLRHDIITTCEQRGIHPSTAATQYSKWKRFNQQEAKNGNE